MNEPATQHPALISQRELMRWLAIGQRAKVERWLKDNSVPYFYGARAQLCTTVQAVNEALRVESDRGRTNIEFE